MGARSTKNTPSGKPSLSSAATCSATRVLAGASRSGQGQQPHARAREEMLHGLDLLLASDERGRLDGQGVVRGVERLKRRKSGRQAVHDQLKEGTVVAHGQAVIGDKSQQA